MSQKIKKLIRTLGTLGEVCMYCKLSQHCGGCSCCQQ